MKLGDVPEFTIATTAANPANERVVHVEVYAPGNAVTPVYRGNLSVRGMQNSMAADGRDKGTIRRLEY